MQSCILLKILGIKYNKDAALNPISDLLWKTWFIYYIDFYTLFAFEPRYFLLKNVAVFATYLYINIIFYDESDFIQIAFFETQINSIVILNDMTKIMVFLFTNLPYNLIGIIILWCSDRKGYIIYKIINKSG